MSFRFESLFFNICDYSDLVTKKSRRSKRLLSGARNAYFCFLLNETRICIPERDVETGNDNFFGTGNLHFISPKMGGGSGQSTVLWRRKPGFVFGDRSKNKSEYQFCLLSEILSIAMTSAIINGKSSGEASSSNLSAKSLILRRMMPMGVPLR